MYIVINKAKAAVIAGITLSVVILVGCVVGILPDGKASGEGKNSVIVIDAGHGMPDGGAVGVNGSVEADLNLDIAKKLSEVLREMGFDTVMTRSDKMGIQGQGGDGWSKTEDMRQRKAVIRQSNPDLVLSIHMNHFTSEKVSGLRLFYAENHKEIKPLAENIQKKISELTGAKVTAVRAADKSLFLMKAPPAPTVLIECGFISNAEEEKKLSDEEYRTKIAWGIAKEVERYFFAENNS